MTLPEGLPVLIIGSLEVLNFVRLTLFHGLGLGLGGVTIVCRLAMYGSGISLSLDAGL